jgi:hypothetical protein
MTVESRCRVMGSSAPGSTRSNPHVIVLSAFPAPTEKTNPAKLKAFLVPGLCALHLSIQFNQIARVSSFREESFFVEKGKRITDLVGFPATKHPSLYDPIWTPPCRLVLGGLVTAAATASNASRGFSLPPPKASCNLIPVGILLRQGLCPLLV